MARDDDDGDPGKSEWDYVRAGSGACVGTERGCFVGGRKSKGAHDAPLVPPMRPCVLAWTVDRLWSLHEDDLDPAADAGALHVDVPVFLLSDHDDFFASHAGCR